jgi:hypothetical protein
MSFQKIAAQVSQISRGGVPPKAPASESLPVCPVIKRFLLRCKSYEIQGRRFETAAVDRLFLQAEGSARTPIIERMRGYFFADFAARFLAPFCASRAGHEKAAEFLLCLPAVTPGSAFDISRSVRDSYRRIPAGVCPPALLLAAASIYAVYRGEATAAADCCAMAAVEAGEMKFVQVILNEALLIRSGRPGVVPLSGY